MNGLIALAFALTNMLGGRFNDVWGEDSPVSGRLLFRVIMPAFILATASSELSGFGVTVYVFFAVLAGSAIWFSSGWSFEEQHGVPDPTKYPKAVRALAYRIWPEDGTLSTNRRRGAFMKGFRGLYDLGTFVLLLPINKFAILYWPATFIMGLVYYLMAKIAAFTKVTNNMVFGIVTAPTDF
jgi:hypothetical protein